MNPIVHLDGDEMFTTSEIIAERAEVEHRAVLQLLTKYSDDFAEFGRVAFEMRTFETAGGQQTRRVARLNEQQSTLLLTFLKNTEQVRKFKKDLVRAFYAMARKLQDRHPAELSRADLARMVLEAEEERAALTADLAEAAPKAEAYDTFIDADGTYSVGTVAKMLGFSQNKLFLELRNRGVLISKGAMRNTPYQQYMHHFSVKAHSFTRSDGAEGTSYTTRVQASGVDFIRRKLQAVAA